MANRVEPHARKKIIEALRRKNRTYAQLSRDFSCSVSTIHRIAEAEGLTNRRARTSPVEVAPDETYDAERRKSTLDRIYKSIDDQVSKGGQSSKQLLDLARAAKEVNSARAAEDKLVDPDSLALEEKRAKVGGDEDGAVLKLVELNATGTPRHLDIYFATLDVSIAREAGKREEELEATDRLLEACAAHGFKEAEVDVDAMLAKLDRDFMAQLDREKARADRLGGGDHKKKKVDSEAEAEFDGRGIS